MTAYEPSRLQDELLSLYRDFFSSAVVPQALVSRLSCPLLVAVGSRWENATRRLLVIGQETLGWDFNTGWYYDWPYPPLKTLADFTQYDNAAHALIEGYSVFAFSKHQPINRRSPFWRAFRLLLQIIHDGGRGDVLWTNLFRCSLDGGSVIDRATSTELSDILAFQHGLLSQEISVLNPTHAVFFTGPRYDRALQSEFPQAAFIPEPGHSERQFARVVHPRLPAATFRTYHPGYLARSRVKWSWLYDIARFTTEAAIPTIGR